MQAKIYSGLLSVFLLLADGAQAGLIGQDDFDGTELFSSKLNSDAKNRGALVWDAVSRATVAEQGVIDTSVSAGGAIGLDTGDVDGFLESTKTDQFFAMYRGGGRSLTYTFDIAGYSDLVLSMDWACSGDIPNPLITVTCSIDGAVPTPIFDVGTSSLGWAETMEDGRGVSNDRSTTVLVNGVAANPLSDLFQTYSPMILSTGSVLTVTMTMASGVSGSAYGLDNIKLYGKDFMDYLPQHLAHLDPYNWDKVQRGCAIRYKDDPAFPADAIPLIAESCTYIHFQDLPQSTREQFTIPYPKRIYRFAYKNLTKHYQRQDSIFLNVPEWFMHDAGGSPNIRVDYPTYNLRNTATLYSGENLHEWWVSNMRSRINSNVPGNTIFIDALGGTLRIGQNEGYDYWGNEIGEGTYFDNTYTDDFLKPLLANVRDEFADEMILTGNFIKPWFEPDGNYEYVRDYIHCSYIENFERTGDGYTDTLNTGINLNKRVSEDGKMTYFHMQTGKPSPAPTLTIEQMRVKASDAMPDFYSSLNQEDQDDLAEMYAYFEFKLAIFLMGANEYSYLSYQTTVIGDDAGDRLFRVVPPFPEFQYSLGEPLSSAVQNGNLWTRDFKYASVWLDSGTGEAEITWYDSPRGGATIEIQALSTIPGYHASAAEATAYRSTSIAKSFDFDGDNAYGTAGSFFFGNGTDASSNMNLTPTWVTGVGAPTEVVVSVNATYDDFDNPTSINANTVSDWTSTGLGVVDNGTAGAWSQLLNFSIDSSAPSNFRVGVMAGNEGNSDGRWDPAGLRLSFNGGTPVEVSGLNADLGMVFFDVTVSSIGLGTFSIEGQTRDVATDKGPTIAGVTFDEIVRLLGQDDFDGAATYASRTVNNPIHNTSKLFDIVNRQTVRTDEVIDTSVEPGGMIALNAADTLGFLGMNKTDNIFGMYRSGAPATLVYTFNIAGYTNLTMNMDWAISGDTPDKNIKVKTSIDGGSTTTILDIGSSNTDWSDTMDIGTIVNGNRSPVLLVNGVAVSNNITDTFQTYRPTIFGTGSVLTVTIVMEDTVGGDFGGAGVDNLKLYGNLSLEDGFSAWVDGYGLSGTDAMEAATPAGDGLPNLVKYTLGLDPNVPSPNPTQFDQTTIGASSYLRLSVTRDPSKVSVLIEGLSSNNLVDWSTDNTVIEVNTPSLFRVRDSQPLETNDQRFIKLRFSLP